MSKITFFNRDPRTASEIIYELIDDIFPRIETYAGYIRKTQITMHTGYNITENELNKCAIPFATLYELSYAYVNFILNGTSNPNWELCYEISILKQSRFSSNLNTSPLNQETIILAKKISINLLNILKTITKDFNILSQNPIIPGIGWIASGVGDFSFDHTLVEIKNTQKKFPLSDFRQVILYWILNYINHLEKNSLDWKFATIINPLKNSYINFNFDHFIKNTTFDLDKVEIIMLFKAFIEDDDRKYQ